MGPRGRRRRSARARRESREGTLRPPQCRGKGAADVDIDALVEITAPTAEEGPSHIASRQQGLLKSRHCQRKTFRPRKSKGLVRPSEGPRSRLRETKETQPRHRLSRPPARETGRGDTHQSTGPTLEWSPGLVSPFHPTPLPTRVSPPDGTRAQGGGVALGLSRVVAAMTAGGVVVLGGTRRTSALTIEGTRAPVPGVCLSGGVLSAGAVRGTGVLPTQGDLRLRPAGVLDNRLMSTLFRGPSSYCSPTLYTVGSGMEYHL